MERKMKAEKKKEKGKGKKGKVGRKKEGKESLRKVGRLTNARTHGCTNTQVILYSVQCYALHWTDNYANKT